MKENAIMLKLKRPLTKKGAYFIAVKERKMKELLTLGKDGLKIAYSALMDFALYLVLGLAIILTVIYVILKLTRSDSLTKFKNVTVGILVGFTVTLTACISLFMITRLIVKAEIDRNFYLILTFTILLFCYAVAGIITSLTNKKAFKICNIIGISLAVLLAIALLFLLPTVGEEYVPLDNGMYYLTGALVLVVAVLLFFFGKDNGTASPSKSLSFAGICISLSFALSYVKLFSLPQGGSVTLASMLPLIIYSYVFGARKGVFAGVIYGLLQCLQSPQIYQPMQVLIDYPLAFGVIGLSGLVKDFKFIKGDLPKFLVGAVIACVLRYLCHFLSGYYVFSSWAMEGYSALGWSFVYNLYIIVELAIILFVGIFLFSSKSMTKEFNSINPEE